MLESKFVSTFADTERTSEANDCGGAIIDLKGESIKQSKKRFHADAEPLEIFQKYINTISYYMSEDSNIGINISVEERNEMCRTARDIGEGNRLNIGHLNPTAFILGYKLTRGGTNPLVNDSHTNKRREERHLEIIKMIGGEYLDIDGNEKKTRGIVDNLKYSFDDSVKAADIIRYARLWELLHNTNWATII
jgi:hypothetical protein